MEQVTIRDKRKEDENFIFNTWLKEYQENSLFAKEIPKSIFFEKHQKIVERLLFQATTKLAVSEEDPDVILGYATFEEPKEALHFIYVKGPFRRLGICNMLLSTIKNDGKLYVSHLTNKGYRMMKKMGWIYNPYLGGL